jgi:hypothetical protein
MVSGQSGRCRKLKSGHSEILEEYTMHLAKRCFASLVLTAVLAAPVAIFAAPVPQEASVQVKFYDKDHNDYHAWDDNENRAWGVYLTDNHKKNHEFKNASKKEQRDYWNWRHQHPDHN